MVKEVDFMVQFLKKGNEAMIKLWNWKRKGQDIGCVEAKEQV